MIRLDQPGFVAQHPYPFLVAINGPLTNAPPASPKPVSGEEQLAIEQTTMLFDDEPEPAGARPAADRPVVHAVRKLHSVAASSIVLGRAVTSDIVITDRQVSNTHALFQGAGDSWELADAGSRNGTWVGNRRLTPRGDAAVIQSGDILSFGHRAYLFLDAADCWEQVRGMIPANP